jgi:hypothetical protein
MSGHPRLARLTDIAEKGVTARHQAEHDGKKHGPL